MRSLRCLTEIAEWGNAALMSTNEPRVTPAAPEPERTSADLYVDVREPGRFEAGAERVRVNEHHGVADVSKAEQRRRRAIGTGEDGPGLQDPVHLAEKTVLQVHRGDVVQHREAHRTGEPLGLVRQLGGVGGLHRDIPGGGKAGSHGVRELRIDFHGGEPVHAPAEQLGGVTSTWADLKRICAKVHVVERPGRDPADLSSP
jgi:hypothetical protein